MCRGGLENLLFCLRYFTAGLQTAPAWVYSRARALSLSVCLSLSLLSLAVSLRLSLDRALYLPTCSHVLIVNKTSRALSHPTGRCAYRPSVTSWLSIKLLSHTPPPPPTLLSLALSLYLPSALSVCPSLLRFSRHGGLKLRFVVEMRRSLQRLLLHSRGHTRCRGGGMRLRCSCV